MNTNQLQCVIGCDELMRSKVLGVYALDRLPVRQKELPYGLIANTETHDKRGKHWIAMYFSKEGGEFFDSYGHKPEYFSYVFSSYLSRNTTVVNYNKIRIQSYSTDVCGEYCLLYLLYRCRNLRMNDFMQLFEKNLDLENDSFVRQYINDSFPLCLPNTTSTVQCCRSYYS